MCVCVCVCVRARACVRACACAAVSITDADVGRRRVKSADLRIATPHQQLAPLAKPRQRFAPPPPRAFRPFLSSLAPPSNQMLARQALQYLHDNGVWHRDVKTANLLVTFSDGVRWARSGVKSCIHTCVNVRPATSQGPEA